MHDINDLFNERDMIIESIGYFNPLILEEHDVILTEGIVGGLVEKIQALWKMIKGWIKKLIDFIASKFSRGKKQGGKVNVTDNPQTKEKSSDEGNPIAEIQKTNQELEKEKEEVQKVNAEISKKAEEVSRKVKEISNKEKEISKKPEVSNKVKEISNKAKEVSKRVELTHKAKEVPKKAEVTNKVKEVPKKTEEQQKKERLKEIEKEKELLRNNIEEYKKIIERTKKRMSTLPKRIKEQENRIAQLQNNEIEYDVKHLKVPDLKNAKNAINDIINDCKKAIMTDDPYKSFSGKPIKMYFLKSNKELDMLLRDFLQNKDFGSYNYDAGQDCIDQLRKYEKSVDAIYNNLQQRASHVSDGNKNEATKIMTKAKGVNQITQQVLKAAVTILSGYVDRIGSLRLRYSVSSRNNTSILKTEKTKLADMKEDYMDLYKEQIASATQKIKACEAQLSSLS